jgi:hypothetical protein
MAVVLRCSNRELGYCDLGNWSIEWMTKRGVEDIAWQLFRGDNLGEALTWLLGVKTIHGFLNTLYVFFQLLQLIVMPG